MKITVEGLPDVGTKVFENIERFVLTMEMPDEEAHLWIYGNLGFVAHTVAILLKMLFKRI
ncbi:MAG: hypothetical protein K6U74_04330 [Firmicutes bacterium]|nr:hypothetical protein [Bacillota bacterium]